MYKAGTRFIWLFTLLWGPGNSLTVKRGGSAGYVNVTAYSQLPGVCNVDGFKDWFKVDKFCVQYFSKPLNFTDAEFSCRAKAPGGHLVSVHSKNDNYDLLAIVTKFNPKNLRIWLGGYEFFKSGKFLWIDGTFWDYQIWTPGEPNNLFKGVEECVEMNWNHVAKWNDDSCAVKKNYICAFKRKGLMDE
ncbi:lectin-like [Triplophysa dalaica]|uniref:lectin-like n=1 Tax=Triplophysa dalaica TaxID=1582913 RepID=UPI0024E03903|nr:lectin-like [Triplophysa dalaica]